MFVGICSDKNKLGERKAHERNENRRALTILNTLRVKNEGTSGSGEEEEPVL